MSFFKESLKTFKKIVFKPYLKMLCMRTIILYQKFLSKGTCMFRPTCSQYMLESINNLGVIVGIFFGTLRLLRCTPFSKGGYDPARENFFKVKWVY